MLVFAVCALVCTAVFAGGRKKAAAAVETPADDPRITYIGRTTVFDGAVHYDWSGVTVKVSFTGGSLKMNCSDSRADWFNLWVDKAQCVEADRVIRIEGDTTIVLAEGLGKGEHSVILQKRTEGEQGTMSVKSFISEGELLQAEGQKARRIEFVGDSYTCGFGTEGASRDDPFLAETENCNLTYAAIIGRYFDADITLVSHSGRGIARNYDDYDQAENMVKKYPQALDEAAGHPELAETPHHFGAAPDLVVIYLGTNDFSTGRQPSMEAWCANYTRLIGMIKDNYGDGVPVLCVASKADEMMGMYVQMAARLCGRPGVHWTAIQESGHNNDTDLGSCWHPNYAGRRKVASCMIPYISTLTGWDMPFKLYE